MKYQLEYHPNPNVLTLHLRIEIISPGSIQSFGEGGYSREEKPKFVEALLRTPGVVSVSLSRYNVLITRGVAFSWEEIIPPVLFVLVNELDPGSEAKEIDIPIRPTARQLAQIAMMSLEDF